MRPSPSVRAIVVLISFDSMNMNEPYAVASAAAMSGACPVKTFLPMAWIT